VQKFTVKMFHGGSDLIGTLIPL